MKAIEKSKDIFKKVSTLIEEARKKVAVTINEEMIILYWNVGKIIKKEVLSHFEWVIAIFLVHRCLVAL